MSPVNWIILLAGLALLGACDSDAPTATPAAPQQATGQPTAAQPAAAKEPAAEAFVTAPLIDPNSASAEVIAAIPGLNQALAQTVIAGRPYATPSDLHAVLKDAVDADHLKQIYSAMFVKVDLNTGSNEDYQLIPTTMLPRRLAHEFEEYRPYDSIDQFGREMSKYVSAQEVAFLQRYVTIQ